VKHDEQRDGRAAVGGDVFGGMSSAGCRRTECRPEASGPSDPEGRRARTRRRQQRSECGPFDSLRSLRKCRRPYGAHAAPTAKERVSTRRVVRSAQENELTSAPSRTPTRRLGGRVAPPNRSDAAASGCGALGAISVAALRPDAFRRPRRRMADAGLSCRSSPCEASLAERDRQRPDARRARPPVQVASRTVGARRDARIAGVGAAGFEPALSDTQSDALPSELRALADVGYESGAKRTREESGTDLPCVARPIAGEVKETR